MGNLGPTELLIIAGVLVLLFGATKLPSLARSLGQSARIFKAETKGMREDKAKEDDASTADSGSSSSTKSTKQISEGTSQQPLDVDAVEESAKQQKSSS